MTELEAKLTQVVAELTATNAALRVSIEEQSALIAQLTARVEELVAAQGRNSSNSSRPPSTDSPYKNVKRKPDRKPSGRKAGGQPGHAPHKREVATADEVYDVLAPFCPHCEAELDETTVVGDSVQVQQVVELVTDKRIAEFHAREHLCKCGRRVRARLRGVVPMTATGPKLQAIVTQFIARYGMSRVDAQQALKEMFGIELSVGAIHAITERAATATQPAVDDIAQQLAAAPSKHCDETGWRHGGQRAWVWVVCSALGAVFRIDERRSRQAFERLLPKLEGIVHTDRWRVYDTIAAEFRQLCHAHLRRDMQALIDLGPATKAIGESLLSASDQMFALWHRFVDGQLDRAALEVAMAPIQADWRAHASLAKAHPHRRARALGKDLLRQWTSLWRFVGVAGVEPTNNRAERIIRATVLLRKTNGGTASVLGAAFVGNLQSIVATARCQGMATLAWLEQMFEAALKRRALPLLLPRPSG